MTHNRLNSFPFYICFVYNTEINKSSNGIKDNIINIIKPRSESRSRQEGEISDALRWFLAVVVAGIVWRRVVVDAPSLGALGMESEGNSDPCIKQLDVLPHHDWMRWISLFLSLN